MFSEKRLIQAILPMGAALPVVKALREDLKIDAANINFARGVGRFVRWADRRLGDDEQKEILNVVVPTERADEIFNWLYEFADIDRPQGGIIYMARLTHASAFSIPEDLELDEGPENEEV